MIGDLLMRVEEKFDQFKSLDKLIKDILSIGWVWVAKSLSASYSQPSDVW